MREQRWGEVDWNLIKKQNETHIGVLNSLPDNKHRGRPNKTSIVCAG